MNPANTKLKFLPLGLLFYVFLTILLSGCKDNFKKLDGKAYLYKDSVYEFTAEFDKDTLYYIMKDARRPFFHRSKFKLKKVDDTTYTLELTDKPPFWTKNTWDIIVKEGDTGFKSKESGNYYKLYSDSLIVKYVF